MRAEGETHELMEREPKLSRGKGEEAENVFLSPHNNFGVRRAGLSRIPNFLYYTSELPVSFPQTELTLTVCISHAWARRGKLVH